MMETWGATCIASPSTARSAGRAILAQTPTPPAAWASPSARRSRSRRDPEDTNYALGSVLNHVLLHQTVIGQEALSRWSWPGNTRDVIIGCAGGGSNFAGLAFPFLGRSWPGGHRIR